MKILFLVLFIFVSGPGHATIQDSNYEAPHQDLIMAKLLNDCDLTTRIPPKQLSSRVVIDRVDQGIIDIYYTTHVNYFVKIDQGVFDEYVAIVNSSQTYSSYAVTKIDCGQKK